VLSSTLNELVSYIPTKKNLTDPVILNIVRNPGIDSQPGGIDSEEFHSWAPETFTNTCSEDEGAI
jgi:hypothetical protein